MGTVFCLWLLMASGCANPSPCPLANENHGGPGRILLDTRLVAIGTVQILNRNGTSQKIDGFKFFPVGVDFRYRFGCGCFVIVIALYKSKNAPSRATRKKHL